MTNAHHFRYQSPGLPETTRRSLESFHRRRQLLALARGASSTVVLFTLLLLLAVAIDAWWLSEVAPWVGSAVLYVMLATALVVWCLLPKLGSVDLLSEARRLEQMEPRLREMLLPAVELSVPQPGVIDSMAFRQQLQSQVAYLLQTVDPRHLLPWTLLQRRATLAAGGLGLLLVLCLLPGLFFPQRMARILLPFSDWGRVSSIAIALERPKPHSQLVPRDDLVSIRALITGPRAEKVILETRQTATTTEPLLGTAQNISRYEMTLWQRSPVARRLPFQSETTRFDYLLPAVDPSMEYRVSSQGASTPWYRLSTLPRPHVIEFEKHVTPPAAITNANAPSPSSNTPTELPDNSPDKSPTATFVAEHGHLHALTGSHVELRLRVDQATRLAELRWESTATPADVAALSNVAAGASQEDLDAVRKPIQTDSLLLRSGASPEQLIVDFTVTHSTDYRIHLQSLESGFTNDFSPSYHIHAVADQAPEIRWLAPQVTSLLAGPNDVLQFKNEIVDEFGLAAVIRSIRINGSQWETHSLPIQTPSQPPQDLRSASSLEWELELAALGLAAGDQLEIKLTATDRQDQSTESAIVSVNVAAAKLADAPAAGVLLRREVAAALERIAHHTSQVNAQLDALLIPTDKSNPASGVPLQINSVLRATNELQQELTDTWATLERAVAQAEDALSSQTLVHVGEAVLAISSTARAAAPRLEQLSSLSERRQLAPGLLELRLQFDADHSRITDVSQHFAAITTHDVISGFAERLRQLADAELHLFANQSPQSRFAPRNLSKGDAATQQLQRRQQVLTEQLKQTQQAMLEALPRVREESRTPLQSTAMQLGQQIAAAENFAAVAKLPVTSELAETLAEQLNQLRLPSRLDRSLTAAIKVAVRRLREMAPPVAQAVEQLVPTMPAAAPPKSPWPTFTEQLVLRRDWERAAPQGDRLYATDLGKTLRAAQTLEAPSELVAPTAVQTARTIAEAIAILQGIHQIHQADKLLAELLETERQGPTDKQRGWLGPVEWYAIEQRLEQGVGTLRTAGLPTATVDAINKLLNTAPGQRAAQVLTERIWKTELPPPVVAELEDLRRHLRPLLQELEVHARRARQILEQLAPTISELAQQAADKVRQVEQQSTQLAEAITRNEVPDLAARQAQLTSQAELLHEPVDRLRQALIDQADAQDLLDRQQTQLARQADAARELVDVVDTQLTQARMDASEALSAKPTSANVQAAQLHAAAGLQSDSAAALAQLAEHFRTLENQPQLPTADQLAAGVAQLQQQKKSLADNPGVDPATPASADPAVDLSADPYAQAEQLAELAALNPQAVLEQLERELPTNAAMAEEMSSIARQAATQSLQQLEQAAQQQTALGNDLELSDANFKAQKVLLLHDLKIAAQSTGRMLDTLTNAAEWTADAGKSRQPAQRIAAAEAAVRELLMQLQEMSLDQPFEQLRAAAAALQSRLSTTQQELSAAAKELVKASFEEFYASGAELANRRREMRDRQRRIQQESVRDAQTLERSQMQRLQQMESELQQLSDERRRTEAQLLTVRRAADQAAQLSSERNTERASLANKVNELEQQLKIDGYHQAARQKLNTALQRRAEQARQALGKLNAEPRRALDSVNPTAELAAQLSQQAAEMSGDLAQQLETWQTAQLATAQATATQLAQAQQQEDGIARVVTQSTDSLSRAARHEQRLQHAEISAQLQQVAEITQQLRVQEIQQVAEQLLQAHNQALHEPQDIARAPAAATTAALTASQLASEAIVSASQELRQLLADRQASAPAADPAASPAADPASANPDNAQQSPSSPSSNTTPPAGSPPLTAAQKARLLDELDQQLNGQQNFGEKEDDSQPAPTSESSSDAPPGTLSDAADQIAKGLSQGRQPAMPPAANPDLGMATQSLNASTEPQAPVAVRIIDVERRGGSWGELPEQAEEELVETRRQAIAPQFRKQTEAYFRELAEQGAAAAGRP